MLFRSSGHVAKNKENYIIQTGDCADYILNGFQVLEEGLKKQQLHIDDFANGFLESLIAIIRNITNENVQKDLPQIENRLSLAEEMRRYIDLNYTQNFSLEDLAQMFH